MSAPRLEVRLDRIHHNARVLVDWLLLRGLSITGITKATLGSPEVARELLRAGVAGLGDSRVENLEALRRAGIDGSLTLVRSPMVSQVERVVRSATVSCNTEPEVLRHLSVAAVRLGITHRVILMVELGDLREGILPIDVPLVVEQVLRLPGIELHGIGTNLACQSGVVPDAAKMAELSALADAIERRFHVQLAVVSGGNSANLDWAFSCPHPGRVNDLRLGEAILLGREPLHRRAIPDLHTDAFTLVAEVIESKTKPTVPWGDRAQTAFGAARLAIDRGPAVRAILALGRQDVDADALVLPRGLALVGSSSDHLIVETTESGAIAPAVGQDVRFGVTYPALLAAMTSPFVSRSYLHAASVVDQPVT